MKKIYSTSFLLISIIVLTAGTIDLGALLNYSNQIVPSYIDKDNTPNNNAITDSGATLGRVLFYDKNLSLNNTISCASCHQQASAFGDPAIQSIGQSGGLTGRHSTRLVNARFGSENNFFWDERADNLEEQTTMPIQDHIEMGFSGTSGNPTIDSLIDKLENLYYYNELFNHAFGDINVTEDRIEKALAQFIRSIQSFDSKYDVGRAQVGNNNVPFPNFTTAENNGKALFMSNSATGCNGCHRAPEFDIDPNSDNNGVIGVAGSPSSLDLTNTRSPSLRDLANSTGVENGPFMHDGSLATIMDVINHYDDIPNNPSNTNLDNRLNGSGGNLNLTTTEKNELEAFLLTLSGNAIYTDARWSDPFDATGSISILNGVLPVNLSYFDLTQENDQVRLEWSTSTEINNSGFDIEYSVNGSEWSSIEFIEGYGTSDDSNLYQAYHKDPINGINYYRLNQLDFDGNRSLSEIKSIIIKHNSINIKIFPNPSVNFIQISGIAESHSVIVYNTNGLIVKNITVESDTKIDISDLSSGSYIMRILDSNNVPVSTQKLIKL